MSEEQEQIWSDKYFLVYGLFYFAQGFGFTMILLIAVFMQNVMGVPAEDSIGYQSIIMIPWYVKLIFGLLSDNIGSKKLGRRKPYILVAGILGIIGWFIFPTFTEFSPIVLLVGIAISLCVALSDAMLDSLACDVTPEDKRGKMQGVGWGCRGLGAAIAGVTLGLTIENVGWNVAFYIPGILVVISCFISLTFKEPKLETEGKVVLFDANAYKNAFKNKDMWIVTLWMIISGSAIAVVMVFATFLNQETGMDIEMIGWGFSAFAAGQFAGAITAGLFSGKFDTFKLMSIYSILYIGLVTTLLFVPVADSWETYLLIVALGALNGGYESIQMKIGMDYAALDMKITGSMYNWYMSLTNIGQIALGATIIAEISRVSNLRIGMQAGSVFMILALAMVIT